MPCHGACLHTMPVCCATFSPKKFATCSRAKGHDGNHMACGVEAISDQHPIYEWEGSQEAKSEEDD